MSWIHYLPNKLSLLLAQQKLIEGVISYEQPLIWTIWNRTARHLWPYKLFLFPNYPFVNKSHCCCTLSVHGLLQFQAHGLKFPIIGTIYISTVLEVLKENFKRVCTVLPLNLLDKASACILENMGPQ